MNDIVIETKAPTAHIAPLREQFVTRDGRTLYLRLIESADAERLVAFFYALSPESRWRRFHIVTDHLDQDTVQARARVYASVDNWQQGGAVIALYHPEATPADPYYAEGAEIVGVARLARGEGKSEATAEIAFVVRDDFQQQGVGQALLHQLVGLARRMAIRQLYADVQADNAPALRSLKKLGLPITTQTRYAHTETTLLVNEGPLA